MIVEVLLFVMLLVLLYLLKVSQDQHYFHQFGLVTPKIKFPIGNSPIFNLDIILQRKNMVDIAKEQYKKMKDHRYYGVFFFNKPSLVVNDPGLIKQIFIKDFNHFVDRNSPTVNRFFEGSTVTDKIWSTQMANVNGDQWKDLRSTFTPVFTSGKLKGMVRFISAINEKLIASIEENVKHDEPFECKDRFGKVSMDVIASCAFGVDAQSFSDPNAMFSKHAKSVFQRNSLDILKIFISIFLPGGTALFKALKIPNFKPTEAQFFYDIIMETLKYRRNGKIRRNDLVDLMLDALKGDLADHELTETEEILKHKPNRNDMDKDLTIVATSVVLMVAGYDSTGETMAHMAYELAKNPEIQERLQDEIDLVIESNGGKLPDYYQTLAMEYLDMVFHETLRLHVILPILTRSCVKDYKMPGSDFVIKAGEEIYFNAAGIANDPKYYPDPQVFDPEHFNPENKSKRHPYAFNGFGQGPRNCIGMRFAMLEAKMAMIEVLSRFSLVKCPQTVEKLTLDPYSILGSAKEGIWIKAIPRANMALSSQHFE